MSPPQLVPRLTSGRWTRRGSKGSTTTSSSQAGGLPQLPPATAGPLRAGSLSRASLSRTPQRNSSGRSARHHHTLHARTAAHDHEDEVRAPSRPGVASLHPMLPTSSPQPTGLHQPQVVDQRPWLSIEI